MSNDQEQHFFAGSICGAALIIVTMLLTWLYCSPNSSSDFVLDALFIAFSFTISCLLAVVVYCLMKIRRCMQEANLGQASRTCETCMAFCGVSIAIIVAILALSLAWTIFMVSMVGLPRRFDEWQLLLYIAYAANLVFHLLVNKKLKAAQRKWNRCPIPVPHVPE